MTATTLRIADHAHRAGCRILSIKASPPSYVVGVETLGDAFVEAFDARSRPVFEAASADLLEQMERHGTQVPERNLDRILARAEKALKAAGADPGVGDQLGRALVAMYRLGVEEVREPMGLPRSAFFELADQDVIAGLHRSGLFWIGNHYGEALPERARMLELVKEAIAVEGLGRVEGGKRLAALFSGVIDRNEAYWRGLAATVATRSRSFGALSSMEAAGVVEYEYVNPLDERTSPVCRRLNGTKFRIEQGVRLREELLTLDNPEAWKERAPWPKERDILDAQGRILPSSALAAKGIAWPPLHFHCRSTIEVAVFGDWPEAEPETPWNGGGVPYTSDELKVALDGWPEPDATADEKKAARDYTAGGFERLNGWLRLGRPMPGEQGWYQAFKGLPEKVAALEGLTRRMTVPRDVLALRGAGSLGDPLIDAWREGMIRPGYRWREAGFSSTTLSPAILSDYLSVAARSYGGMPMELRVQLAKGQRGVLLGDLSVFDREVEVLLPPGARYEVIAVQRGTIPVITVRVETR